MHWLYEIRETCLSYPNAQTNVKVKYVHKISVKKYQNPHCITYTYPQTTTDGRFACSHVVQLDFSMAIRVTAKPSLSYFVSRMR
jgi:hypothetical protein